MSKPKLDYTPWALAREVGLTEPDNAESPGSEFLLRIQSDVNALEDEELDVDDGPHEIADSAVPYRTYVIWQTFTDLCAWEWDDEIGSDHPDMTDQAISYLYQIGSRLAYSLIDERLGADDEVEESDDDE